MNTGKKFHSGNAVDMNTSKEFIPDKTVDINTCKEHIPDNVIEFRKVTKYYNGNIGCKDISFTVGRGEVCGLIGRNGAGKSTVIKIMTGLIFPSGGNALLFGKPAEDAFASFKTGYLPEIFRYQEWMTINKLLLFHTALLKLDKKTSIKNISRVLELVNMKESGSTRVADLSKGMQQRIGLAVALLSEPELLVLDEPVSALDAIGRRAFRELIKTLKSEGVTIFISSHLLGELEQICTHIKVMDRGEIIGSYCIDELKIKKNTIELKLDSLPEKLLHYLGEKAENIHVNYYEDGVEVSLNLRELSDIPEISSAAVHFGSRLFCIRQVEESLEDAYIEMLKGFDK